MRQIKELTNDQLHMILEHEFLNRISKNLNYSGQILENRQITFLKKLFLDRSRISFYVFEALNKYGYSFSNDNDEREQLIEMYESIVYSFIEHQDQTLLPS